jgi:DNA-binding transcriptional MerR regulator
VVMDEHGEAELTIGQLSRRTGLPVRTIRYWSDIGAVPPTGRTPSGYRLYDIECVARLDLVRTLRELGLRLGEVQRILEKETTLAEIAAAHVEALDAQMRILRLRRAVLSTVARRRSSTEEIALMNRLARLSAEERKQIIDGFLAEVLGDVDAAQGVRAHLRLGTPELPDDPTPEQVDAWVELAEMIQDPDFRRGVRALAEYSAPRPADRERPEDQMEDSVSFARRVNELAGAALSAGIAPESPEGADVLDRLLAGAPGAYQRVKLLERLEIITESNPERYWELVATINGWPPYPPQTPTVDHITAGLRAHRWVATALRAHP